MGYPYVKKVNRQNKKDLDQVKQDIIDALERCINERVLVSSQDRQASSVCQGVAEEAKRLQGSKSNYERGLSKAVISNDLEAAELEFSTAINQQLPMLYKYYFQRADATLWIMPHIF